MQKYIYMIKCNYKIVAVGLSMSKLDKAKERLALRPKDYTYSEARYLLT